MKIHLGLDDLNPIPGAVVTSGTFDGVHIGHQKILTRIKEIAQIKGGETVVITFWPHPRLILYPDNHQLQLLSTFDEKCEILREQGIDHLVAIPFTKQFSQLSSVQFIQKVLIEKIGTRTLVIGYDHRFGKNREGSFEHLKSNAQVYGFDVEEISKQEVDDIAVSSTKIRKALDLGEVEIAHSYLGRPYSFTGVVVEGNKIGRNLGFPTANIYIEEKYKLIPADGVFAVLVLVKNQSLKGMLNIGIRPTIGDQKRMIEVNIFDFEGDLYGEKIKIELVKRIRSEKKFDNLEQLKKQLDEDKNLAIEILST
jgi:riboflavin kinase/FMN adenylyltransferase